MWESQISSVHIVRHLLTVLLSALVKVWIFEIFKVRHFFYLTFRDTKTWTLEPRKVIAVNVYVKIDKLRFGKFGIRFILLFPRKRSFWLINYWGPQTFVMEICWLNFLMIWLHFPLSHPLHVFEDAYKNCKCIEKNHCQCVPRFEAFPWTLICFDFFAQIAWFEGQAPPLLYFHVTYLKPKLRKDLLRMGLVRGIILELIYYRL